MADVNVKTQSSNSGSQSSQEQGTNVARRSESGSGPVQRQQGGSPWGWGLTPQEFFSANPFTLMRRMSEEMDRTFGQFFGDRGERARRPAACARGPAGHQAGGREGGSE